jgi:hypothetical protein
MLCRTWRYASLPEYIFMEIFCQHGTVTLLYAAAALDHKLLSRFQITNIFRFVMRVALNTEITSLTLIPPIFLFAPAHGIYFLLLVRTP